MNNELQASIDTYRKNAANHGKATIEGDYESANKCHDLLIKALNEIRSYGEEGSIALLSMVDEKNDSVKCWAATHSLKYDENKSEQVLKELSLEKGPIAFNAEMVLSEWEKGTLEIP
jgi:hypothetical protein